MSKNIILLCTYILIHSVFLESNSEILEKNVALADDIKKNERPNDFDECYAFYEKQEPFDDDALSNGNQFIFFISVLLYFMQSNIR